MEIKGLRSENVRETFILVNGKGQGKNGFDQS